MSNVKTKYNSSYEEYRQEVDKIKSFVVSRYRIGANPYWREISIINPPVVDHIKPARQCYDEGYDTAQCSNPSNLRHYPRQRNLQEGARVGNKIVLYGFDTTINYLRRLNW